MRSLKFLRRSFAAAIIALAGCTEPRAEPTRVGISLDVQASHSAPVMLTSTIGVAHLQLTASPGGRAVSNELQVSPARAVAVALVAYSPAGDSLAGFTTSQDLESNYQYGFGADIGRVRPLSICGAVIAAVPLRASVNDTLFISSNGGIPVGAIC